MGTYIAFGIIVLILLFFLAWAWEEPAGGIIAIIAGVIFYLSGSHTVGIVAGIGGIVCYIHAKEAKKEAKKEAHKTASRSYFSLELEKLLERCWNTDMREFNWNLWLSEDWVLVAGGDENLEKELRERAGSELQSYGECQIDRINILLKGMENPNANRDRIVMTIKNYEESIVRSLNWMFNASSEQLRREVRQYQTDLYDYIIYDRKQLSSEKLSDMIQRGDAIFHRNIK